MSKERRLGRGLEALLGRVGEPEQAQATPPIEVAPPADHGLSVVGGEPDDDHEGPPIEPAKTSPSEAELPGGALTRDENGQAWLDVYSIDRNPFQPREVFDDGDLRSLIESIQSHGVLQPLVVRRMDNRFQLISGERRLRAATAAGWERVPVQIRDANDRQMAELAIVENVQRKDLGPLEKAASFVRYLEQYQCTQDELAKRVNIDRSTVSNLCRLLELPEDVKKMLRKKEITQGHARALLPLGEEREQIAMAQRVCREGLNVRKTEDAVTDQVRRLDAEPFAVVGADGERRQTLPPKTRSSHLTSLEQELRSALGTKVDVKQTSRGKGRIAIHFTSREEFDRLRSLLVAGKKDVASG